MQIDLSRTHVAMAEIRRKVWKCGHDVAFGFFQLLHRTNGKGMTKIMHPAFWCSDLPGQLLVMVVDGLCPEIVASGRGEDQRRLLFLWGGPTLP